MDLGLRGRAAIVTGGSQGIGRAVARALAEEGVRVAICARTEDTLNQTAREIRAETGVEVLPVRADVGVLGDVQRMVATTLDAFGRVDILVNNAASFRSAPLMELADEDWLNHYNVKFVGDVRCVRAVLPSMKANRWGRIINVGGGASRQVDMGGYSSGAVNTAVVNFTAKLAHEVAPFGITANAIHPGDTMTRRRVLAFERDMRERGLSREEFEREHLAHIPIGRRIQPEDIAYAVLCFASEKASAVTGQVISVDGGAARGIFY